MTDVAIVVVAMLIDLAIVAPWIQRQIEKGKRQ